MKTCQEIKSLLKVLLLVTIYVVITAGNSPAQVNTNQLQDRVIKHLANYYTNEFTISADQQGIITVRGEMNTLFDKLKIGELISQVKGVRGIKNMIDVNSDITADDIIRANIEHELDRNNAILEPEKIKVDVNNGVVDLSGTVSYFREKLLAQSIASWQDGVTDMKSNIKVLSPASARSDENLKEIIGDIINRYFSFEKNVKFDINKGVVHLYGPVTSLYAKNHIQEEIQRVLGVKDVKNEIEVENNYL